MNADYITVKLVDLADVLRVKGWRIRRTWWQGGRMWAETEAVDETGQEPGVGSGKGSTRNEDARSQ